MAVLNIYNPTRQMIPLLVRGEHGKLHTKFVAPRSQVSLDESVVGPNLNGLVARKVLRVSKKEVAPAAPAKAPTKKRLSRRKKK